MSNEPRLPTLVNQATGERHVLNDPVIKLGRADDNQVILPEDGYASASHARIFWENGIWWIEDLGSSNGTSVNDKLLTKPHQLAPLDVIKVGRTFFRIE